MTWPPAAAKLVVNVDVPSAPTATIPRITEPSLNVTVPVGMPAPGATADTVAVKVTGWPVPVGLIDGLRATVVAAGLTVSVTNADLLGAKVLLPTKEAASECTPTPSDRVSVAWPAALTGAV